MALSVLQTHIRPTAVELQWLQSLTSWVVMVLTVPRTTSATLLLLTVLNVSAVFAVVTVLLRRRGKLGVSSLMIRAVLTLRSSLVRRGSWMTPISLTLLVP